MALSVDRHIRSLESLRFIFIFLIFISHFSWNESGFWDCGGDCGVSFFFILSGFALSLSGNTLSKGYAAFIYRRLNRIYPSHLLALLLAFICMPWCFNMLNTGLSLTLLQSWIPVKESYFGTNPVAWFLSDLLLFYLIFPRLKKWIFNSSTGMLIFTAATTVVIYLAVIAPIIPADMVNWTLYVFPPLRLIDFCLGIMLSRVFLSRPTNHSLITATLMEMAAVALLVAVIAAYPYLPERYATAAIFWAPCGLLIFVFANTDSSPGFISQILRWKPLLWLGAVSFEFYLVHVSIIVLAHRICQHDAWNLSYIAAFSVTFASSIAAAIIMKWTIRKIRHSRFKEY